MRPATLLLSPALMALFARVSGDASPLHMDPAFARLTQHREPIVHGLLPVLAALALYGTGAGAGGPALRLGRLSCRFHQAIRVGQHVRLQVVPQPHDALAMSFDVHDLQGQVLTSGQAAFRPGPAGEPDGEGPPSLFRHMPAERTLAPGDVAAGHQDRLEFMASPAALRALLAGIAAHLATDPTSREPDPLPFASSAADAALAACLAASTLVGMRMPGRLATFLELQASFGTALEPARPVVLEGQVERVHAGSGRLQIGLRWLQDGADRGHGSAMALVSHEPPRPMPYAAVAAHLPLGLQGQVALVTGASRGIGAATASLLAAAGARCVLHYFRGEADAQALAQEIRAGGGQAIALGADLRRDDAVAQLFAEAARVFGAVDILVNCAVGDFIPRPVEALCAADFLQELEISLFGLHACCAQALPAMKARRAGKIINLGSTVTQLPVPSQAKYIAAKSAVVGYTRSLAVEVAGFNIQVNLVSPAMTATSLIASVPAALRSRIAEDAPTGRLLQPVEVAQAIAFLASRWSGAITGQQLVLSQGAAPFL